MFAARARGTLLLLPSDSLLVLTRTLISAFLQLITEKRRPANPMSDNASPSRQCWRLSKSGSPVLLQLSFQLSAGFWAAVSCLEQEMVKLTP